MAETITQPSFEEIVEPIEAEMSTTANEILGAQSNPALGGVLGVELATDPNDAPFANSSLSCTNPSCNVCSSCNSDGSCSNGGGKL